MLARCTTCNKILVASTADMQWRDVTGQVLCPRFYRKRLWHMLGPRHNALQG